MKHSALLIYFLPLITLAQTDSESREVMKPITALFAGMNLGDSAMVHRAFTRDATMSSIGKDKTNKPTIRRETSMAGFFKAIGSPRKEPWSEPIWDTRVQIDGDFAQVWTQYAFYVGKTFSHCGVDAFQLIRMEGEWKIFYIADTRRKEGCIIPKSVSDQYN